MNGSANTADEHDLAGIAAENADYEIGLAAVSRGILIRGNRG